MRVLQTSENLAEDFAAALGCKQHCRVCVALKMTYKMGHAPNQSRRTELKRPSIGN